MHPQCRRVCSSSESGEDHEREVGDGRYNVTQGQANFIVQENLLVEIPERAIPLKWIIR